MNRIEERINNLIKNNSKLPPLASAIIFYLLFHISLSAISYLAKQFPTISEKLEMVLAPVPLIFLLIALWRFSDINENLASFIHKFIIVIFPIASIAYLLIVVGVLSM